MISKINLRAFYFFVDLIKNIFLLLNKYILPVWLLRKIVFVTTIVSYENAQTTFSYKS